MLVQLTQSMTEQEERVVQNTNNLYLSAMLPIGAIVPFGGTTPPLGTLLCDGSAVSRVTYAALFAAIGTTYGAGDGSTTFNLPNLKGRVPVGAGTDTNGITYTRGQTGGEPTHKLTTPEMPSHSHKYVNTPNSSGTFSDWVPTTSMNQITDYRNTTSTGGDQPHNNMQPFVVTNFIIVWAGGVSQAQIDVFSGAVQANADRAAAAAATATSKATEVTNNAAAVQTNADAVAANKAIVDTNTQTCINKASEATTARDEAVEAYNNTVSVLVTLTQSQYDALVSAGTVNPNTTYFVVPN